MSDKKKANDVLESERMKERSTYCRILGVTLKVGAHFPFVLCVRPPGNGLEEICEPSTNRLILLGFQTLIFRSMNPPS